jgi:ubiquinone biosynthesis accessory factor UbiK
MAWVDRLLQGMKSVKEDTHPRVQGILKKALTRMDLVTRTEFDAQAKVLAKANCTLAALQARLESLQKQSDSRID